MKNNYKNMKHLKTFESYSNDEMVNEEFVGNLLKTILSIPISFLAILALQFVPGRMMNEVMKNNLLNLYSNIDRIISILERLSNSIDVTDVEKRKINDKIKELKKVKEKYPTLDDYKKFVIKKATILNLKNRKYLRNQILNYQPRILSEDGLVDLIKKTYKHATRSDVREPGQPDHRDRLGDQLDNMLRHNRGDNDFEDEDDRPDYDAF
jgi:hypothetical protein